MGQGVVGWWSPKSSWLSQVKSQILNNLSSNSNFVFAMTHGMVSKALCADAGDEESEIIRLHDRSLIEISEVPTRLANLLKRLEFLFVDKGAAKSGYTGYVLGYLSRERLIRLSDGTWTVKHVHLI